MSVCWCVATAWCVSGCLSGLYVCGNVAAWVSLHGCVFVSALLIVGCVNGLQRVCVCRGVCLRVSGSGCGGLFAS